MAVITECLRFGEKITIEDALRIRLNHPIERGEFTCLACGEALRVHAEGTTGSRAHFEHYVANPYCAYSKQASTTISSERNYWWVSQKQTYRHEVGQGYMWSPKYKQNGTKFFAYEFMKRVRPGDVVFSFADAHIKAIGVANTQAYTFPKPLEFGTAGIYWSDEGWRIDVEYREIETPFRPKEKIPNFRDLLPAEYSPLRPDGHGNQSYLFRIDQRFAIALAEQIDNVALALVRGNMVSEAVEGFSSADANIQIWEDRIQADIESSPVLSKTETTHLIKARIGQGRFREQLLKRETRCRITNVSRPEHLIASHIKPWRSADNEERLNPENGFMLTPSVDHLFDKGYISFQDNGRILLADIADRDELARMGIDDRRLKESVGSFTSEQKKFLEWHRNQQLLG